MTYVDCPSVDSFGGSTPHGIRGAKEQDRCHTVHCRYDHVQRESLPSGPGSAALQGSRPGHAAWRIVLDRRMGSARLRQQRQVRRVRKNEARGEKGKGFNVLI